MVCGKVPGGQQQGKSELPSLSAVASDASDHMMDFSKVLRIRFCLYTQS